MTAICDIHIAKSTVSIRPVKPAIDGYFAIYAGNY